MDYSMILISIMNFSFDIKICLWIDKFSRGNIILLSKSIKILDFCFWEKISEIGKVLLIVLFFKSCLEFFLKLRIFNNILNSLIFQFFLNILKILLINFWQLNLDIRRMNSSLEEHLRKLNNSHKIFLLNSST